jgi:ribosomal protein L13E
LKIFRRLGCSRQVQFAHAVLRNALSCACREELLMRNVAKLVQVPTPRYRIGKGLSVDRVKALLAVTAQHRLVRAVCARRRDGSPAG